LVTLLSGLRRFLWRCRGWFRRGHADRQLTREIDAHLALMEEEFLRQGLSPEEARRVARVKFGGIESVKEQQRRARSFGWLDDARRDVAYAVRSIRRAPGFSAAAIVTLALGIGGVTLIYSVVYHVIFSPLPYRDPGRMVTLEVRFDHNGSTRNFGDEEFRAYARADAFDEVAGVVPGRSFFVTGAAGARRLIGALVTPNIFGYLGMSPLLGRGFGPADVAVDAPPAVVLSHGTWTSLFGQDPNAVGTTIRLNEEPCTIIGVMPPRFAWAGADLWTPIALTSASARGVSFQFHARLRPDISLESAESQLTAIATHASVFAAERGRTVVRGALTPIVDRLVGNVRGLLWTMLAAVGLLLFIACCNIANMLLARSTVREHEIATRQALGASRARVVRQLLAENTVLASAGATGGCLMAFVGIGVGQAWLPRLGLPAEIQLGIDLPVLVFTLAVTVIVTLAFGLYPAVQSVRRDLVATPGHAARGATASRHHRRLRSGLVIVEVALSLVLVIGAGLLLRSFLRAMDFDLGFDHREVAVAGIGFSRGAEPEPPASVAFYRAVMDGTRRLQGVKGVAVSSAFPPLGGGRQSELGVDGWQGSDLPRAGVVFTSEGIVDALGVPVVAGRRLFATEIDQARPVMLINETMARRYFDGRNPVGRTVRIGRLTRAPTSVEFGVDGRPIRTPRSVGPGMAPEFEIVGVIGDVANAGVRRAVEPEAYVPYTVATENVPKRLFIRATGGAGPLTAGLRNQIAAASPVAALTALESLPQAFPGGWPINDEQRFTLTLFGLFAATALGLVALGVYGVIAYTVAQQTREFAIRVALGGTPRHVMTQVLATTARLVGSGVVAGLGVSLASGRVLASRLDGVSQHDPATFAAAVAVMAFTAALGCALPVRRATRVDPNVALRQE
jgi:putative ABC transport system permease protein